jgi:periplasmic divalent cation tolerance protein
MDSDPIVVLCTCPDEASAQALSRGLVEAGVAGCVNRLPGVRSTYRWEGRVLDEGEVLLIIKTVTSAYPSLEERLIALHPYETPEILALPVLAGAPGYVSWLQAVIREPPSAQVGEQPPGSGE